MAERVQTQPVTTSVGDGRGPAAEPQLGDLFRQARAGSVRSSARDGSREGGAGDKVKTSPGTRQEAVGAVLRRRGRRCHAGTLSLLLPMGDAWQVRAGALSWACWSLAIGPSL